MAAAHLFQIFYDEVTKSKLDPGFIPLDNTENIRPDWYEYLPISQCFSQIDLNDDEYFGVFSPKFFEKTGMSSSDVRTALEKTDAAVISFSPWYAHMVLHRNIFIQAEKSHPGAIKLFQKILPELGIDIDPNECVMSSEQTIFCNYFVAKKWVWKEWIKFSEKLFFLAESHDGYIGGKLRQITSYNNVVGVPMKVFILERLMSSWLASKSIDAYFGTDLKKCKLGYDLEGDELSLECLIVLDDLKRRYICDGDPANIIEYKKLYDEFCVPH
jgi:hypothetical protein